jgi:hypothetical protein
VAQVDFVEPLAQKVAVPVVQFGSVLHEHVAAPAAPVQLWCVPQATGPAATYMQPSTSTAQVVLALPLEQKSPATVQAVALQAQAAVPPVVEQVECGPHATAALQLVHPLVSASQVSTPPEAQRLAPAVQVEAQPPSPPSLTPPSPPAAPVVPAEPVVPAPPSASLPAAPVVPAVPVVPAPPSPPAAPVVPPPPVPATPVCPSFGPSFASGLLLLPPHPIPQPRPTTRATASAIRED